MGNHFNILYTTIRDSINRLLIIETPHIEVDLHYFNISVFILFAVSNAITHNAEIVYLSSVNNILGIEIIWSLNSETMLHLSS